MSELRFTLYGHPEPQGSTKAFVVNGRARITSANAKMKPYRHSLTQLAMDCLLLMGQNAPLCPQGTPVEVTVVWTLAKPKSTPKRVKHPAKKPDADKLLRCLLDSLTGVAYYDDAQVVKVTCQKQYGVPESTEVHVREVEQ